MTDRFYDGGFFSVDLDENVALSIVREATSSDDKWMRLSEIRAYQLPNLVDDSITVITDWVPMSKSPTVTTDNLITNLSARSNRYNKRPIVDADGSVASDYSSCFMVDPTDAENSAVASEFSIGFDIGVTKYVHAVLFLQASKNNSIGQNDDSELQNSTLTQIYVYVGDSSVYSENTMCDGSPYLDADFDDYADNFAVTNQGVAMSPAFGLESWCNLEGRYVFFVSQNVPDGSFDICHVGIFGTRYLRDQTIESSVTVQAGDSYTMNIDHIYSEESIGNTLDIKLRQPEASTLSWVDTSGDQDTFTEVTIAPSAETTEPGTYTLYLESYDGNSNV